MSQMESNNRKARSCPKGHVFEDKELEYCPECGLPLRDIDNKAQSSSAHTATQDSAQDFNGNRSVLSGNAPQTNPNESLKQESSSTDEVKKPKKRLLRIILLLLMLYIVTVGIICGIGYKTGNLDLLKTGLDLSIVGKNIFPEQYQLVAERAEMEKADSKGVIVYYKNKTGDVILYRERLELSPGYHEINPPEFFGQRKFYGESSHKTYVDENGHADPNIFHFYYDDPTAETSNNAERGNGVTETVVPTKTNTTEPTATPTPKPTATPTPKPTATPTPKPTMIPMPESKYQPYRKVIDEIETIVARNPWSMNDISKAFVQQYGSTEAVSALESYTFHQIDVGDVTLRYYNGDWYYEYSVQYYDNAHRHLFELQYVRVVDQSYCDTNMPTYTNWFTRECVLVPLMSANGNEYHLYYGDGSTNQYVNAQYYDSTTVSMFIVWDGWELYR